MNVAIYVYPNDFPEDAETLKREIRDMDAPVDAIDIVHLDENGEEI